MGGVLVGEEGEGDVEGYEDGHEDGGVNTGGQGGKVWDVLPEDDDDDDGRVRV